MGSVFVFQVNFCVTDGCWSANVCCLLSCTGFSPNLTETRKSDENAKRPNLFLQAFVNQSGEKHAMIIRGCLCA